MIGPRNVLVLALLLQGLVVVLGQTCPNGCSSHGSCNVDSTCSCDYPWDGVDCSMKWADVLGSTFTTMQGVFATFFTGSTLLMSWLLCTVIYDRFRGTRHRKKSVKLTQMKPEKGVITPTGAAGVAIPGANVPLIPSTPSHNATNSNGFNVSFTPETEIRTVEAPRPNQPHKGTISSLHKDKELTRAKSPSVASPPTPVGTSSGTPSPSTPEVAGGTGTIVAPAEPEEYSPYTFTFADPKVIMRGRHRRAPSRVETVEVDCQFLCRSCVDCCTMDKAKNCLQKLNKPQARTVFPIWVCFLLRTVEWLADPLAWTSSNRIPMVARDVMLHVGVLCLLLAAANLCHLWIDIQSTLYPGLKSWFDKNKRALLAVNGFYVVVVIVTMILHVVQPNQLLWLQLDLSGLLITITFSHAMFMAFGCRLMRQLQTVDASAHFDSNPTLGKLSKFLGVYCFLMTLAMIGVLAAAVTGAETNRGPYNAAAMAWIRSVLELCIGWTLAIAVAGRIKTNRTDDGDVGSGASSKPSKAGKDSKTKFDKPLTKGGSSSGLMRVGSDLAAAVASDSIITIKEASVSKEDKEHSMSRGRNDSTASRTRHDSKGNNKSGGVGSPTSPTPLLELLNLDGTKPTPGSNILHRGTGSAGGHTRNKSHSQISNDSTHSATGKKKSLKWAGADGSKSETGASDLDWSVIEDAELGADEAHILARVANVDQANANANARAAVEQTAAKGAVASFSAWFKRARRSSASNNTHSDLGPSTHSHKHGAQAQSAIETAGSRKKKPHTKVPSEIPLVGIENLGITLDNDTSLADVLNLEAGYLALLEFSKHELAQENLLFWKAVQQLRKKCAAQREWSWDTHADCVKDAYNIMNSFVYDFAPSAVNISSQSRFNLIQAWKRQMSFLATPLPEVEPPLDSHGKTSYLVSSSPVTTTVAIAPNSSIRDSYVLDIASVNNALNSGSSASSSATAASTTSSPTTPGSESRRLTFSVLNIFDQAAAEVYELMSIDLLPRFVAAHRRRVAFEQYKSANSPSSASHGRPSVGTPHSILRLSNASKGDESHRLTRTGSGNAVTISAAPALSSPSSEARRRTVPASIITNLARDVPSKASGAGAAAAQGQQQQQPDSAGNSAGVGTPSTPHSASVNSEPGNRSPPIELASAADISSSSSSRALRRSSSDLRTRAGLTDSTTSLLTAAVANSGVHHDEDQLRTNTDS